MSDTTTDYDTEAQDTLAKCGGRLKITLKDKKTAPWDSEKNPLLRHHYVCVLSGPGGVYQFDFWGSNHAYKTREEPTAYDVLACLEWYTPEDFKEFCAEYGYNEDSRKALATFKRCQAQTAALRHVFPEENIRAALAGIR